jgi:glycosyltransferase involved in cell wall biosynthesis
MTDLNRTAGISPRIVAIIPTYNNLSTVGTVISETITHVNDVIIVNDGSTDGTASVLSEAADRNKSLTVITFAANRGKGAALAAGLAKAAELGFTNAVTLDADGQHYPSDIPPFLEKITRSPEKLYIGDRVLPGGRSGQPLRSHAGAKFGAFWFKFITGIPVADTQCGFRAYPVSPVLALKCKGTRYEYEQEVMIKAAWTGIAIEAVPIHLHYEARGKMVSHFRPVRDFLRISRVNSRAALIKVLLPFRIVDMPGATWKEKIIALFKHELHANTTPKKASFSISLGVFIGLLPIYFFQVLSIIVLSFIIKINRPLALLGVSVSSAPFLPFIIACAIAVGRLVVPASRHAAFEHRHYSSIISGGIDWFVGSIILAFVCAGTCWALSYPFFLRLNARRKSADPG